MMQPPSFSFFLFVIFYPEVALYVCFSSGIPKHQRAALRVRVDKETNNKVDPKEGALFNGFHRTSTMQQQLAAGINSSRLRSFRDAITFLFFLQADLATELSKLFLFESHNRGNGDADRRFKWQSAWTHLKRRCTFQWNSSQRNCQRLAAASREKVIHFPSWISMMQSPLFTQPRFYSGSVILKAKSRSIKGERGAFFHFR